jgi:flagellar assembly protein FliH
MYVDNGNAKVIDSNAKAEEKLKEIAVELAKKCGEEPDFVEGFTQGIKAVDVSALVGEDGEYEGDGEFSEETDGEGNPVLYKKSIPVAAADVKARDDLIAEAKVQIETMKKEAVTQIEQQKVQVLEESKNQGYQEGLEKGHKEGYDKGHQEGLDSVEELKTKLKEDNEQLQTRLEAQYQQKLKEAEPKFIDTLTGIYEHIFHVSLKNSRELIVYLVQNTMRNIEGGGTYVVHVSKEDFPFASVQKKELVKGTNISLDSVELLEDATLNKNECMIETGNGVFDCSLGTQLEALNEQLKLLSYEG